jgi:hypothetical protein
MFPLWMFLHCASNADYLYVNAKESMTGIGSTFIEPRQWNSTGISCQRASTWLRRLSTNAYGDCRLQTLSSIAN